MSCIADWCINMFRILITKIGSFNNNLILNMLVVVHKYKSATKIAESML
ncbi:3610_t:CDS:2 [Cetraspora pellucida]|uniref:3610_t:CDS:1 n=1 Tax=Cetraspora pellucida TaxID=1433469 RepID=A0A9N8VG66_9GLOM|nr:3610_t:CDS:2 [Cetraspora pellucida]